VVQDVVRDLGERVQAGDILADVNSALRESLPRFDAETAPALIPNVTVGRIANRLDIMGPSYTVDAACASSLVAIDIGMKGLRQGEYDLAIQIEARTRPSAPLFDGANMAMAQAAQAAYARGDRGEASRLAKLVLAAWTTADVKPPILDRMKQIAR
jgi:3-oxoacyl-(acyl-carrier-protein) synthase